jgi:hypothetical protein
MLYEVAIGSLRRRFRITKRCYPAVRSVRQRSGTGSGDEEQKPTARKPTSSPEKPSGERDSSRPSTGGDESAP